MLTINAGEVRQGVLGGIDNYLFLFDGGQQQFAHLVGERVPTSGSVGNFFKNLESRHSYCQSRGITYLHLVFPSKPVVATEKLPAPWRDRVQSLFLSNYASMWSEGCPPWLCYPRDYLRELNVQRPVFKELDTHLSNYGSASVMRWMLQKLDLYYDPSEHFTEFPTNLSGDLSRMLGLTDMLPGVSIRSILPVQLFDNRKALPSNTNNMAVLHNPYTASELRLLIFGDSFIREALLYLAPCFRDIVYIRSATFQADLVELIGPDVVFSSNAERYLSKVESDRDSSSVLMALHGVESYTPPADFHKALTAQLAWRHHRSAYEKWREALRQTNFAMGRLGLCKPNDQIQVLDVSKGCFQSLGKDPFFVFHRTPLIAGRHYVLQFQMHSEVASIATVYYQNGDGAPFGESCTVNLPVVKGDNNICFQLGSEQLGCSLRLDPLRCPGRFTITGMALTEIAANR